MTNRDLNQLTDEELRSEAKKLKTFSITNALLIGFLGGIIFYSIIKNSWGLLTLIPLFLIYKLMNDPKNKRSRAVEVLMKERNLQ